MTISIVDTKVYKILSTGQEYRHADILISDGQNSYQWGVGGLPLAGNLQAILDNREAELLAAAGAEGRPFDVFEVAERRLLKALALVIMDEINALRAAVIPALPARNEGQIRQAILNKLKAL